MKGYVEYQEITKEILENLQVGDLVKVNDWKKPMRVKGVSANYAVMVQNQFGKTYYSVIEKKPRESCAHNDMLPGCFHCGPDDWIFGDSDFNYKFDDTVAINDYLQKFESGINHLSERRGAHIKILLVKTDDPCQPCHNALNCLVWAREGLKAKCDYWGYFKKHYASGAKKIVGVEMIDGLEEKA